MKLAAIMLRKYEGIIKIFLNKKLEQCFKFVIQKLFMKLFQPFLVRLSAHTSLSNLRLKIIWYFFFNL